MKAPVNSTIKNIDRRRCVRDALKCEQNEGMIVKKTNMLGQIVSDKLKHIFGSRKTISYKGFISLYC